MVIKRELVVGFRDEERLVRHVACQRGVRVAFAAETVFAAGELRITGPKNVTQHVVVASNITENPKSMIRVLLLAAALRAQRVKHLELVAPWIAYGRQDRSDEPGTSPAGGVIAKLLATTFDQITTWDAHSKRFMGAFHGRLKNILPDPFAVAGCFDSIDVVAAPDEGARLRAQRIAKAIGVPSLIIQKRRRGSEVIASLSKKDIRLDGRRVLIIDDIADSGMTLVAAAKLLRQSGASSVSVFVTHAVDVESLRQTTRDCVDRIEAGFDHRSGNMKDVAF